MKANAHVIALLPLVSCNCKFDAFDSWHLCESENQVQGYQRFFFLAALRLVFAISRLCLSHLV